LISSGNPKPRRSAFGAFGSRGSTFGVSMYHASVSLTEFRLIARAGLRRSLDHGSHAARGLAEHIFALAEIDDRYRHIHDARRAWGRGGQRPAPRLEESRRCSRRG
jgi:hypothetical protein